MHRGYRNNFLAVVTLTFLAGCMDAGDVGLGPACEADLSAAERELTNAKTHNIGSAIGWAQAGTLIAAARTQQQFSEYENCVLKARKAREIIARRG